MIKAVIYDLDGTLIDSLEDIKDAINDALKQANVPFKYTYEEVKYLIGNGADILIHRALKEFDEPNLFANVKSIYMPLYEEYQLKHTKPFNGILDMLLSLQKHGLKAYICSNKPDLLAKAIVEHCFGNFAFDGVYGNVSNIPVKPNPYFPNKICDDSRLSKDEVLFCGDSHVDIETAHNAGMKCVLCKWGYDFYEPELVSKSDFAISTPKEIIPYCF